MVCPKCGSPVQGAFCSNCGVPVQPPPPSAGYGAGPAVMYVPRVARHVHTLGILWCVYGAYRVAAAIFAALFLMGVSTPAFMGGIGPRGEPFLPFAPVMSGLAAVALVFILCTSALAFATGYSLMTRRPWGRTLAIVVAAISLIKLPVGTALGIYTLWVLAPGASGVEYDAMADHSELGH